ncbi:MAG TPA: hypothetical protein VI968_02900 [archaeon]|nr:hypothetical protein [archaeon]
MGRIERVKFDVVRPTEYFPSFAEVTRRYGDDISDDTIRYVLWFHLHDRVQQLGPSVGKVSGDEVHVIDGHHKLIVADLLGMPDAEFYLPDNEADFILPEMFSFLHRGALTSMNLNIAYRSRRLNVNVEAAARDGIRTVNELRMQYPKLQNLADAASHYDFTSLRTAELPPPFIERSGGIVDDA